MEDLNAKTESDMVTILDLSGVPYVDQSGAKVLKTWMEKGGDKITDKDRSRLLAAPTAKVERMLVTFEISRDVLFPSLLDAVRYCKDRRASEIAGRINRAYSRTEEEAEGGGKDNASVGTSNGRVDDSSDEEGQDSGISRSGSPNQRSNTIKSTHL